MYIKVLRIYSMIQRATARDTPIATTMGTTMAILNAICKPYQDGGLYVQSNPSPSYPAGQVHSTPLRVSTQNAASKHGPSAQVNGR